MITSSNFFNKTIFNGEEQYLNQQHQVGPWLISKSRKFATMDVSQKDNRKSHSRYQQKYNYEIPIRSSTKPNSKSIIHPLNLSINKQPGDINEKIKRVRQKDKKQCYLPYIQNYLNKKIQKSELITSRKDTSPLAYQLNFITKKPFRKQRKKNYISGLNRVEQYLNTHINSKYNIYQKCVVQIKKANSKSKQITKN